MRKHIPLAPGWLLCKKDDGSVCAQFGNDSDFQVTIFSDVLVIEPVRESRLFEQRIFIPFVVIEALRNHNQFFSETHNMQIKVQYFNLFGSRTMAKMMEQDGLPHNTPTTTTLDALFELTKRYDVTLRTRDSITRVFLAQQTTYLPGPSDE